MMMMMMIIIIIIMSKIFVLLSMSCWKGSVVPLRLVLADLGYLGCGFRGTQPRNSVRTNKN